MSEPELPKQDIDPGLRDSIREQAEGRLNLITNLVKEIGGTGAEMDNILPSPPEVRDEAPMPDWTAEQESRVREVGRQLGYGAEQDVISGLEGAVCIAEGGKIWKILAEAEAVKAEDTSRVIFAAAKFRMLGEDERNFLKEKYDLTLPPEATEYDAAYWVASSQLEGDPAPVVLPFGYELSEGNSVIQQATGQLHRIGHTPDGRSIELLEVNRSTEGQFKPSNDRIMGLVAEILTLEGGDTSAPVVFATSNTYASRQVNAIRNGLEQGRQFGVSMYGRETIKNLGAPVPAETPLNHLPGDLRIMHDSLQKLLAETA